MLKTTIATSVLATSVFGGFPTAAQVTSDTCGVSFMIMPHGECLDLSYLAVLGNNRATREQAEVFYQQQLEANTELESFYNQYPDLEDETEEEREARHESILEISAWKDEALADAQSIEDLLFPIHYRAMNELSGSLSLNPINAMN